MSSSALRWYLPLAVFVAAFNLRPALLSVGLVLPQIERSFALSPLGAGALTALPILALGLAPIVAVPLARRTGWTGALAIATLLIIAGILLRSTGSVVALYLGALLLGAGIGWGNVYVPTLVKARLAAHIGLAMGIYTMILTLGALISTSLMPALLAWSGGSWQTALAVWALPGVAGIAALLPVLRAGDRPAQRVAGAGFWRSGLAWAVSAYMGLQSATFYAMSLWLGPLMLARGLSLHDVAADLGAYFLSQFIAALGAPLVLTRIRHQGIMGAALAFATALLIVAVLYEPTPYVFVSCAVLGIVFGAMFAVALTFQVIRARTADSAARLSAMALTVGYTLASLGPLVLGLVNKLPDARLASAAWIVLLGLCTVVAGLLAGRPRFVDD